MGVHDVDWLIVYKWFNNQCAHPEGKLYERYS